MYPGEHISENGRVEVEVRRGIQAGANAWRKVEGVVLDRKMSRMLKGHGIMCSVVPASMRDLKAVALSDEHQSRPHCCENNRIRRISDAYRV